MSEQKSTQVIINLSGFEQKYRLKTLIRNNSATNNIILIGFDKGFINCFQKTKNFNIKYIPEFPNLPLHFHLIFLPFQFLFYFVNIFGIIFHLHNVKEIYTTTENGILQMIVSWLMAKIFGCRFCLDIWAFNWTSLYKHAILFFSRRASVITVPSKSMKFMLLQNNISSNVIFTSVGPEFQPYPDMKDRICEMFGIKKLSIIVAVPIHQITDEHATKFQHFASLLQESHLFIVFADTKAVLHFSSKTTPKNIKVMNRYIDAYPQILGSCDVGISFDGAPDVLDVSPELLQMKSSGIPIFCLRHGCTSEVIKDGFNGLLVDDIDDLFSNLRNFNLIQEMHQKCINQILSPHIFSSSI